MGNEINKRVIGSAVDMREFIRENLLMAIAVSIALAGTWSIGNYAEQEVARLDGFSTNPVVIMELQLIAIQTMGMLIVLCTVSLLCVILNKVINTPVE